MNIYEKLATARVLLQEKNLKKSGKNKFANFDYYEISDFLPEICKIEKELNFISLIDFSGENKAFLRIIDIENPSDIITFTSAIVASEVKGANALQNLGATQTYIRRYLYLQAFEITESDATDATIGKSKNETPEIVKTKEISIDNYNKIVELIKTEKPENVKKAKENFNYFLKLGALSKEQKTIIENLLKQVNYAA